MKNFFKKNKILLFSLSILILWAIYAILVWYDYKTHNLLIECHDPLFFFFIILDVEFYILQLILPLFVMIPSIWNFHQKMNTGFIKNCATRMKYKQCLKVFYKEALKSILIIPIFLVVLLLLCGILADGFALGSRPDLYAEYSSTINDYAYMYKEFIVVYFLNIFLYSIFYVNLALISCRKKANVAVSMILSFIIFISLELIIDVFICGIFFGRLLNIHNTVNLLSFTGVIMYDDVNLIHTVLYALFLAFSSFIVFYLCYKNEEKVMIEFEK